MAKTFLKNILTKCGEAIETAKHVIFDCPALCRIEALIWKLSRRREDRRHRTWQHATSANRSRSGRTPHSSYSCSFSSRYFASEFRRMPYFTGTSPSSLTTNVKITRISNEMCDHNLNRFDHPIPDKQKGLPLNGLIPNKKLLEKLETLVNPPTIQDFLTNISDNVERDHFSGFRTALKSSKPTLSWPAPNSETMVLSHEELWRLDPSGGGSAPSTCNAEWKSLRLMYDPESLQYNVHRNLKESKK
nr:unnamed protein product [Callosobruchus chinensis]